MFLVSIEIDGNSWFLGVMASRKALKAAVEFIPCRKVGR